MGVIGACVADLKGFWRTLVHFFWEQKNPQRYLYLAHFLSGCDKILAALGAGRSKLIPRNL